PTKPPRGFPIEEGLYSHLSEHVASEADLIAAYRELAEAPDTPDAARYLIRIVLEDEERHHRLFREMIIALGNGIAWAYDPGAVPNLPVAQGFPALEEVTDQFLAAERDDQKQLQQLRKELRPFRATRMWSLLVELMEHDTAKHIEVLTFIRSNIARRPKT
ncbi:MAG: hypothetical protein ACRDVW_09645, partial [Acidimicrobiales bacterium]